MQIEIRNLCHQNSYINLMENDYLIKVESSTISRATAINSQFCKSILKLILSGSLTLFKNNGLSILDIVSSLLTMYEADIINGNFTYCIKSLYLVDQILSSQIRQEDINRDLNLQQRLLIR